MRTRTSQPEGAAVAPHGELQPQALPNQITKPIGTVDHWWLAEFTEAP
jgi:hypothetical protein